MIWISLFFMSFFFSLKSLFFINDFFSLASDSIFMGSICFLVLFLILRFFMAFLSPLDNFSYCHFFLLLNLLVLFCFVSDFTFFFLFFLELTVYPMTFLILLLSKDSDKYSASIFMVSINIFGSIPFMYFSSFLMSLDFFLHNFQIFFCIFSFDNFFLMFCCILILCSKIPVLFFHFWLTKAHVSAFGSCSMILASLMLKLGTYGLLKFAFFFSSISFIFSSYSFSVSLMGSLVFCFLMVRYFDIKYLIACSSVLHMALIFPLVLLLLSSGVVSSVFMMVGHGVVSFFLFFLVSIIYELSLNRSSDFNKSLESFSKNLILSFFVFIFLNLGVPPFMNFFSELIFSLSLLTYSLFCFLTFVTVMTISIVFTMFLSLKFIFGKKNLIMKDDLFFSFNFYSFFYFIFLLLLIFMF